MREDNLDWFSFFLILWLFIVAIFSLIQLLQVAFILFIKFFVIPAILAFFITAFLMLVSKDERKKEKRKRE